MILVDDFWAVAWEWTNFWDTRVSVQDKLNVWANIHFRSPEMSISAGICQDSYNAHVFVCVFVFNAAKYELLVNFIE